MLSLKNKEINILVVEDNPLDILIIKALLKPYFNIETVSDGRATLTIIKEKKFDIILMDINLGENSIDGIALMKKIRENKKYDHVKIIAVTAYSEGTEQYLLEGFNAAYTKPVIKEDIFEYINKHTLNDKVQSV